MSILSSLKNAYISFAQACSTLQPFMLLAMRLLWGWLFVQAGMGKLENIDSAVGAFQNLGIPFPEFNAHFVAWVETIGGVCFMLGFATRLVSIPLIITMIVAILTAHNEVLHNLFEDPSRLFKAAPFTYLLTSLILLVFGPGKISLDYLIEKMIGAKIEK